jgi:hypothetical protein
MRIAHVVDYVVGGIYNLDTLPPEFQDHIGTVYHILEPFQQDVDIGWRYEGGDFLPPLDTSSNFGRIVTVLAYRKRFTRAERTVIKYASRQTTLNAAGLASDLDDLNAASYINLDIADTITATHEIEAATLIAAGRANEILSDPVYSAELPSQLRLKYGLPEIPTEAEMLVNSGRGYTTVGEFFAGNPEYINK